MNFIKRVFRLCSVSCDTVKGKINPDSQDQTLSRCVGSIISLGSMIMNETPRIYFLCKLTYLSLLDSKGFTLPFDLSDTMRGFDLYLRYQLSIPIYQVPSTLSRCMLSCRTTGWKCATNPK